MRRTVPPVIAVYFLLALAGCSGNSAASGESAARDSAGIEIVEHRGQAPAAWSLSGTPRVRIGREDGDERYLLASVAGALRLSDGRIVIAHGNRLAFYDSTGVHQRDVGRSGGGPGEFGALLRLLPCGGDSSATWDFGRARVQVYDEEATIVRVIELPRARGAPVPVHTCGDAGLLADFSAARARGTPQSAGTSAREIRRDTMALAWIRPDGEAGDTVLRYPATESYDGLLPPFGRPTALAVFGDRIALATNETSEIRIHSLDGRPQRIVRLDAEPAGVTADDVARLRAQYLRGVPPSLAEREIVPRFDAAPVPGTMPFWSELRVDRAGRLWARRYHPYREGETPHWTIFAPDGSLLGTLEPPADLRFTDVGADWVLGVSTDSVGVQRVELYELRPPSP